MLLTPTAPNTATWVLMQEKYYASFQIYVQGQSALSLSRKIKRQEHRYDQENRLRWNEC